MEIEREREVEKGREREKRERREIGSQRDIFLKQINRQRMGKRMCKTSYSRKKTEMVTAKQGEINERDATTYKERIMERQKLTLGESV